MTRSFNNGDKCIACHKGLLSFKDTFPMFTYNGTPSYLSLEIFICDLCNKEFIDDSCIESTEPIK